MKKFLIILFTTKFILECFIGPVYSHSDPCPVPSPCHCEKNTINCENAGLNIFPKFTVVNVTYPWWSLYFSNNSITEIPERVFETIKVYWLGLGNNNVSYIHDDAFYGSEDSLDSLFLEQNNLPSVPSALAKLNNLAAIKLQYNPIKTYSDEIMMHLSKNLQFFMFGSPEMIEFPRTVKHMKNLNFISFFNLPMPDLPADAFHGLNIRKIDMNFEYTNLKHIPEALKNVQKIESLDLVNNSRLLSSRINKNSFKGMSSLNFLTMENCSLTEVPNLTELHNLILLGFSNCPIMRWNPGTMPKDSSVSRVQLDQTEIAAVPSIISELRNLTSLSLFRSKIKEIDNDDFAGLTNLRTLTISYSPVHIISDEAFRNNKGLQALNLDNLKLTGFPKAIKSIPQLRNLDLSNNTIDCSCAAMWWLKGWSGIKYTYVNGECHNIKMKINDFLHNEVNKC